MMKRWVKKRRMMKGRMMEKDGKGRMMRRRDHKGTGDEKRDDGER